MESFIIIFSIIWSIILIIWMLRIKDNQKEIIEELKKIRNLNWELLDHFRNPPKDQ